jgi:putative flippase GtrA
MNRYHQFARFVLVGAAGLVVNLGVTHAGVVLLGVWYFWSYLAGVLCGWSASFVLNSIFTFPGHERTAYGRKYALYLAIYGVVFVINAAMVYTMTSLMGIHYLVSITVSALVTTLLSYTAVKYAVFNA